MRRAAFALNGAVLFAAAFLVSRDAGRTPPATGPLWFAACHTLCLVAAAAGGVVSVVYAIAEPLLRERKESPQ